MQRGWRGALNSLRLGGITATGVGRRQRADRFDNLSFSGMAVLLLASVSVGFARAPKACLAGQLIDRPLFRLM